MNSNERTDLSHLRFHQFYNGIPIWGDRILVTLNPDGTVRYMHGDIVRGLAEDIIVTEPTLSAEAAVQHAKRLQRHADPLDIARIDSAASSELVIYLNEAESAHLAYAISYFSDIPGGGDPALPTYLLDAHTGEVLEYYDALPTAKVGTGPGGNVKTGQYHYGTDFGKINVTVSGNTCKMQTTHVDTYDYDNPSAPFSFTCYNNTYKFINDGYSPINDAQFFGDIVNQMYTDWYGASPLSIKIKLYAHYGSNEDNAFWNPDPGEKEGVGAYFGDGYTTFYPLSSALDVVSHEISHGFTEQYSELIYSGDQSGGINESFSDIAGEAAEYYITGSNDFLAAEDIYKGSGAYRYMQNPPADGESIDDALNYEAPMDPHYSSGVFNRAFYVLAHRSGWTTRKVFDIFVYANQNFWDENETFPQAAQGLRDAATVHGYSSTDVKEAFFSVNVPLPTLSGYCKFSWQTQTQWGINYHCCPGGGQEGNPGPYYREDISCPLFLSFSPNPQTAAGAPN